MFTSWLPQYNAIQLCWSQNVFIPGAPRVAGWEWDPILGWWDECLPLLSVFSGNEYVTTVAEVSEMRLLEHKVAQWPRRFQCTTRVSEALRPGDLETWPSRQSPLALSQLGDCFFPDVPRDV